MEVHHSGPACVAFKVIIVVGHFYVATKADTDPPVWQDVNPNDPMMVHMCHEALHMHLRKMKQWIQDLEITWRRHAQKRFDDEKGIWIYKADFSASNCATCRDVIHCNATQTVRPWTNDKELTVDCHEPYLPDLRCGGNPCKKLKLKKRPKKEWQDPPFLDLEAHGDMRSRPNLRVDSLPLDWHEPPFLDLEQLAKKSKTRANSRMDEPPFFDLEAKSDARSKAILRFDEPPFFDLEEPPFVRN